MNADPVIEMVGAGVGTDPGVAPLLSGVTWSVRSGEFWVVTGTHGAGKSLLLETMAGIQPCRGGDIRWFGNRPGTPEDSESGRARLGVRLGLVFDGGGRVFSSQTVAENLCIPLCYHSGCDWDEAYLALLDVPGIGPWTASYIRMRALGDPDVALPGDLGIVRGAARFGLDPDDPRWKPWRSYAMHYLWNLED